MELLACLDPELKGKGTPLRMYSYDDMMMYAYYLCWLHGWFCFWSWFLTYLITWKTQSVVLC